MTRKYNKREEAVELLEEYILRNNLQGGDRLPSERQLSELWGFNRMTVRNAIQKLANEHVLTIVSGSGTYVAKKRLIRNLQNTLGFHESAEIDSRTISTIVLESSVIEANKHLGQKLKIVLGSPVIKLVRMRYLDDIPTSYSMVYLDAKRCEFIENLSLDNVSLYKALREKFEVEPCSGEQSISITYCTEYEANLFNLEEGSPIFFQSGVTRDNNGKIFEYFKELTRSDQIILASELKRKEIE